MIRLYLCFHLDDLAVHHRPRNLNNPSTNPSAYFEGKTEGIVPGAIDFYITQSFLFKSVMANTSLSEYRCTHTDTATGVEFCALRTFDVLEKKLWRARIK